MSDGSAKQAVTLIGLGPMGRAMGKVLLAAGHPVTVWGRTRSRADGLVREGAVFAGSAAEAVAASEAVLLSLTDYQAMYDVLKGVPSLEGKAVVNLSSGTPAEAREGAAWVAERGGRFLSGGVMSPAPGIGSAEMTTFYSGDEEVADRFRGVLEVLTSVDYRGADPGLSQAYYQVQLGLFWTTMTGFLHALALSEAEGIPVETITPYLIGANDMAAFFEGTARQVREGDFAGDEDRMAMGAASIEHVVHASRDAGVDTDLPDAVSALFRRGLGAGLQDDSFAALITLMRPARG
ncbi:NAD(P)-dependent oxidoreductase [Nocardiopsis potens]|uniref:NAD(P)-dependent oxidoreductase n=1 Tax=Nocardiopsis potens TaxID=1246458 RepID=UPI0003459D7B|nr:NAD(P)-binding domain-containing protein [Nocardiopsis potens]